MRIGITGCTGFIGSHLLESLSKKGHDVKCLVRKESNINKIRNFQVETIVGNYLHSESLIPFVKDIDVIYHVAGQIRGRKREDFMRGNFVITKNLVDAIKRGNPKLKRIIYVSSQAAAGPSSSLEPVKPQDSPRPVSDYGESKKMAEDYIKSSAIPYTIVRPSVVYGPRDYGMLYVFKGAHRGIIVTLTTPLLFDLIYVFDLLAILEAALESPIAEGKTYFATDGNHYSIDSVKDILEMVVKKKVKLFKIPTKLMKILSPTLSFDWSPITSDKLRELSQKYWICSSEETYRDLKVKIPKQDVLHSFKETYEFYLREGYIK